jgi:retinol dehydrogenase 12
MTIITSDTLKNRVALVTGANTGIGLVTARELSRRGAHVFIACRSLERGQAVIDEIRRSVPGARVELLELDLGDLNSVRRCATNFLRRDLLLHLLINNAGLAGARGLSTSGFEMAFGVNHIGHFLLTQLLLDRLKQSAPSRIVTVSSRAHTRVDGIEWERVIKPTQTATGFKEYGVSKLANLLFSAELGRRLDGTGVTTYALHPGVVASDVWREVPWPFRALMKLTMISVEEGAKTTLHCATAPELNDETALYYDKCKLKEPTRVGQDAQLAAELWRRSEAWIETPAR